MSADFARLFGNVFLLDDIKTGRAGGADQRVVRMRVSGCIAFTNPLLRSPNPSKHPAFAPGEYPTAPASKNADASAKVLGNCDNIGNDAFGLKSEHLAEFAKTRLLFIDDQ